jgi:hypothetical protein
MRIRINNIHLQYVILVDDLTLSFLSLTPHSSPAPFPYTPCSVRCSFHLFVLYYDTRLPRLQIKSNQSINRMDRVYLSGPFASHIPWLVSSTLFSLFLILSLQRCRGGVFFVFRLRMIFIRAKKTVIILATFNSNHNPLNAHELCYLSIAPSHEHLFIALILAVKGIDR